MNGIPIASIMDLLLSEYVVSEEDCIFLVQRGVEYCNSIESLEKMKRIVDSALEYERADVS